MTKRVGSGTGSRVEPAPAMESAPVVKLVPAMESDMCMKVALKTFKDISGSGRGPKIQ